MVASNGGPMFIKAIDGSSEYKEKHFIARLLNDVIKEIEHEKVVKSSLIMLYMIRATGALIEGEYPKIFWTPCVVHTLNLALKNICVAKNTKKNEHMRNVVGLHVLLMMHPSYVFLLWTIQWGWQCLMNFVH